MEVPDEFPFPFPAYKIQKEFMKKLYACIEKGNLGIFESPTGTGKSLSIICGSLKWLIDHEKSRKEELVSSIAKLDNKLKKTVNDSNDWFTLQSEQIQYNLERQTLQAKLDAIVRHEIKVQNYKKKAKEDNDKRKKIHGKTEVELKQPQKNNLVTDNENNEVEKDLILEDIISLGSSEDEEEEEEENVQYETTKIFFCSRTHSQLSQFVRELKRSPYSENVSVTILASRQNCCINKNVKRLKNVNLMNERCLQLQKKKTTCKEEKGLKKSKTTTSCPFLPGNQELLMAKLISNIQDIEEVTKTAEELNTCAYYTIRKSTEEVQLVLVPYNSILHKNTRISLGISLKGNILIIDEAHNILDAIERMHSISISGRDILHSYNQLFQYQKRYQALFNAKNVLYLNQLSFCLKKLLTVFGGTVKSLPTDKTSEKAVTQLYNMQQFEIMTEIDTINIFDLINFVKKSKLIHKLRSFVEQYGNNVKIHETPKNTSGVTQFLGSIKSNMNNEENISQIDTSRNDEEISSPLMLIISFLECLKNSCADGRIIVIPASTVGQGIIKFLLLNPAAHFYDIVTEARTVILAGGTMEPVSEFTEQLFLAAGAAPERITIFSCDHVVAAENIMSNVVTCGPTGVEFEFTFQNRNKKELLDELGRALQNFCNVVPAGIVVFLPSYDYEDLIYNHLSKSGVIDKISIKKRIFREPKLSSQVNEVLDQYAYHINNPTAPQNGSLLFSVIGGKLSEGLNFSDNLGRCIIVVGMPYPNIKSLELQEKMKYLNENIKADAGKNFYENSCMKAVNQCIGRAVRHINDYSTVMLIDKRYRYKIKTLPRWIQRTLTVSNSFGSTIGATAKFFALKRKNISN